MRDEGVARPVYVAFQEALASRTLAPGESLRLHVLFEVTACGSALGSAKKLSLDDMIAIYHAANH